MRAREYCRHFRDNETKFERRFILGLNAVKKDRAWFEDLIRLFRVALHATPAMEKKVALAN
jgi:hypothetical protein